MPPESPPRARRLDGLPLRRTPVLHVTLYERVSSFMMTLVFGIAIGVVGAISYWLSHRPPPEPEPVPLEFVELEEEVDFGGSLEGVVGGTAELDSGEEGGGGGEPTSEEAIVDTALTSLESVANQAADTLMITDPNATGSAPAAAAPSYLGMSTANAPGTGSGGGRPPLGFGPGRGGGVPRELRWFVKFAAENSLDEYARQLDYFQIELGVHYPDGRLVYVSRLSPAAPIKREAASGKGEERLYFTWQGGERRDSDLKLLTKAGVQVGQGRILHFYKEDLEKTLATIERNYANRKAKEIRRTYFVVVKQGSGYTFQVTRQTYLQ